MSEANGTTETTRKAGSTRTPRDASDSRQNDATSRRTATAVESRGDSSDGRNEASQPGFTGAVALVALVLALAVALRRG